MPVRWPRNFPSYGVTRDFNSPRFTAAILVGGTIWVTFVTILSVATVGYELHSVVTSDFNGTTPLWYEKFLRYTPWMPQTKTCDSSIIKVGDSDSPLAEPSNGSCCDR